MLDRLRSYPNQQIWRALGDFVRANALALSLILLGTGLYTVLVTWLLDGYLAGLIVGVSASIVVAMLGLIFFLVTGTTGSLAGSIGESTTADALRSATRRGHVFGWLDNLQVNGADVDHLVVSPAGLLMIDSKWHGSPVTSATLEKDAAAASAAALHARSILKSVHVRRPQVRQLVVVWGGEQLTVTGQRVGEVEFVAGRDLRSWLEKNAASGNAYNASQAAGLLLDLKAFKRRVRPTIRWRARPALPNPSHT